MAGPWEQYAQPQAGPWTQYATQPAQQPTQASTGGIGSEIYNAGKSALGSITEAFNPYSATNTARMEQYKQSGPFDLSPGLSGLATTGKGILGVPELVSAPTTGLARGTIGRAFDALSPSFSEADKAKLAQLGVQPATGREVADTAMMGLRPSSDNPIGQVTKAAPVPTGADLKSAYKSVVEDPAVKGTKIPIGEVKVLAASAQNDLTSSGFRPTPKSAPETFNTLNGLTPAEPPQPAFWDRVQSEMNGTPLPAAPKVDSVTVDDLLAARRALGKTAIERDASGGMTPDALAAKEVMKKIDGLVESYVPQMKAANANYAAYKRSAEFDLRGQKAQNNAAAANSGMNLENQLRSQVRQILNNPKLQAGYDQATLDAFREFNRGSRASNVIRAIGNVLGGGGGVVGTGMSAGAGMLAGGPVGAVAAPMAGVAVKALGNRMALNQFDALSQMIRANSPLARNAPPIPVSGPNPFLGGVAAGQLPQMLGFGLRPMFGVLPGRADQQQ